MRKMMVVTAICGWLVAGGTFGADGGDEMSLRAATAKTRVFNVLNYGAVGDDQTDNTEAFSACLKAVFAAGGGKMFIPDGIYRGRIINRGRDRRIPIMHGRRSSVIFTIP